jgi:hypothetical protein
MQSPFGLVRSISPSNPPPMQSLPGSPSRARPDRIPGSGKGETISPSNPPPTRPEPRRGSILGRGYGEMISPSSPPPLLTFFFLFLVILVKIKPYFIKLVVIYPIVFIVNKSLESQNYFLLKARLIRLKSYGGAKVKKPSQTPIPRAPRLTVFSHQVIHRSAAG